MHAGKKYTLKEYIVWTKRSTSRLVILSVVPTVLFVCMGWTWLAVPWAPVTLIGTAAAFIAGFRNNATYGRLWEARQVWGRIVNSSRALGIMVQGFIRSASKDDSAKIHNEIIGRHIAWLTALRFQLREPRSWENARVNPKFVEYSKNYVVYEWTENKHEELARYLTDEEHELVRHKSNLASQILALQSSRLRALQEQKIINDLNYVELENLLKEFYDHQGGCERIKNFPYPRQFASINIIFVTAFIVMVPFCMLNEFAKMGPFAVWLNIPFSIVVSWVFTVLEGVGESTENPFEGSANDVPITAISRTIEIDLLEMLDVKNIPSPRVPVNNILT